MLLIYDTAGNSLSFARPLCQSLLIRIVCGGEIWSTETSGQYGIAPHRFCSVSGGDLGTGHLGYLPRCDECSLNAGNDLCSPLNEHTVAHWSEGLILIVTL